MKKVLICTTIFAIGCQLQAQVSFSLSDTLGIGVHPSSVTAADINGDGKVDLICANQADNTLSVFTNNGSGGFVTAGTYAVGSNPFSATTADVNGDGKPDLICANYGNDNISVLTNNGSSGFVLAGTYSTGGHHPYSLAATDVNGNGKLDLICANSLGDTIAVLTNNGSGGFVVAGSYPVGSNPVSITAADVNGDGQPDFVSANFYANSLSVYTNNGSGAFALAQTVATSGPYAVTAADVNGDGKQDLIAANYYNKTVSVFTNNGSGGFVLAGIYGVGNGPQWVATADVNGDGWPDIISADSTDSTLSVLTNNGAGGFVLAGAYAVGQNPVSVVAADVNGDGEPDLISANFSAGTLSVLTNSTPLPPSGCLPPPTGLVSCWPGEGNAEDIIGANNGIATSGLTYTNGKVRQAFNLNTTDDNFYVPASPSLNVGLGSGFTVEAWIKPSNVNGIHPICEWNNDQDNPLPTTRHVGVVFCVGTDPSSVGMLGAALITTNGNGYIFTSPANTLVANQWQHVALEYDRTTGNGTLYVNGAIVAQQNFGSMVLQTSYNLWVGHRPGDSPGDWTYNTILGGPLDELSLYNRALSPAEIAAIYQAGSGGKCLPSPIPPAIITQPTNQFVTVGDNVSFSVTASGTAPLNYQWSLNTTNINGATNATLTLNDVQLSDAGYYSVTVTNLYGSVTSSNALLNVNQSPVADATATMPTVISANYSNATVVLNGTLSYDPDGDSLQYTWYQTGSPNQLATGVIATVVLPVGNNSITLTVSDGLASSQQTIMVNVITLPQAVEQLQATVTTQVAKSQPLMATLNAALGSINRGNFTAAINQLQAFQNKVKSQIAPLNPPLAQTLIDEAQSIINALSSNAG
jgi:hypothetical protein